MAGPAYFDAFRRIVVQPDNITISADAVDDTLTLVAGAGISLVANAGSDQITIVNTNTSSPTNDLFAKSLTVDGIIIDTNTIRGTDSNADLELDASGTGAVSVIGNLKVSGVLASSSTKIAIGSGAGNTNQTTGAIAIGVQAGELNQSLAVAIGFGAGQGSQGFMATAVGNGTGLSSQGTYAVAVGTNAGQTSQGAYAVAIGSNAGTTNQPANSIIINAGSSPLQGSAAGLFIDPIRNVSNNNLLTYDTSTKEITYTTANNLTIGSININTNVIQTVDSNANLELAANGSGIVKALDYFEMSDGTSPQGEWTNFTPTWTASSSNPTIGNGLIEGRYKQVGKTVHVWMMMTAGSTTTFGTGEYKVNLPVAARAIASVVLDLVMYDNGTRHYNSLAHNDYTTGGSLNNTSVTLFWDTGVVTNTAPFTWTDGDWFIISGIYEAS